MIYARIQSAYYIFELLSRNSGRLLFCRRCGGNFKYNYSLSSSTRSLTSSTSSLSSSSAISEKVADDHDNKRAERHPLLDKFIRVDHAGELGADRIYAGQLAVLKDTDVGPLIKHMWDQEKHHLATFEKLIPIYRVRPTVMLPIWRVAGFVLGAGTALISKEAAMACTVAVESVIGEHYNDQIRALIEEDPEKHKDLLKTIRQFRDEEMEHHDHGIEHDAEKAPFYIALSQVIKVGCKGAIWISERY